MAGRGLDATLLSDLRELAVPVATEMPRGEGLEFAGLLPGMAMATGEDGDGSPDARGR